MGHPEGAYIKPQRDSNNPCEAFIYTLYFGYQNYDFILLQPLKKGG
jgi:hypothetical protein